MFRMSSFRCIQPFGFRGKKPSVHAPVSPAPSKIPYGGFSPVRLQTSLGGQPSPSARAGGLYGRYFLLAQFRTCCSVIMTFVPSERARCRVGCARPVALGSATGCSVRRRLRLLWPHPRLWHPAAAYFMLFRNVQRPCPSNARASPIYSACPLTRAVCRIPAVLTTSFDYLSVASVAFILLGEDSATALSDRSGLVRWLTRLHSSLYAAARVMVCPATARTFTIELSPPVSPPDDVDYC